PAARRAHEPPGPGQPRGAGGRAARLRRLGPAGVARPGPAGRGGDADGGDRGQAPALLRRRLDRVHARARRAPGGARVMRGQVTGSLPARPERDRAAAFLLGRHASAADRIEPWDGGRALLAPTLPDLWDAN